MRVTTLFASLNAISASVRHAGTRKETREISGSPKYDEVLTENSVICRIHCHLFWKDRPILLHSRLICISEQWRIDILSPDNARDQIDSVLTGCVYNEDAGAQPLPRLSSQVTTYGDLITIDYFLYFPLRGVSRTMRKYARVAKCRDKEERV